MDRIKTNVEGLDELIEGGLPKGNSLLVAGSSGTGKTILAAQILLNRAKEGDPALYVTFEEDEKKLVRQMERLGFPVELLIKKGLMSIYPVNGDFDIEEMFQDIQEIIADKKIKLVALDSLNMMVGLGRYYSKATKELLYKKDKLIPAGTELDRNSINFIVRKIEKQNVTPIFIDEADEKGENITKLGVAEFICDGVIVLNYLIVGTTSSRNLHIRKMRETKHSESVHPIEIVEGKGIVVKKAEEAFKI